MKKVIILTSIVLTTAFFSQVNAQAEAQRLELCTKVAGNTFLSSYTINLEQPSGGGRQQPFKQALLMRKGNMYKFTVCTDDESTGEAYLELYDEGKRIGSTYNASTGKIFQSFEFECNKSATYVIFVKIKDEKKGSAISVLSHVKTL